ncbi:MAG: biotin carboxylase N-terminal domain-containing protein, partial [Thermodesulfobacteriota bacterium]
MSRPIAALAIVNRGEAAMRCVRAVKALRALEGSALRAVALYTDVDRDAPFVRQADAAHRLPSPRGEVAAYLDHDLLIAALRAAQADAVWPGWGFVAEDPAFADRVAAEGMRFLGPPGDAMRLLGDKIAAKRLAERTGVPVAPWSGDAVQDAAGAERAARTIGFPLVVKAAAGGGGRGIRVVERASELAEAFRGAAAEARAAFGDARVFLERRIAGGRHVEVQIARDEHGHAVAFGCRDCSVQRRHQKVIEEAPPPGLARPLLEQLVHAALRLAEQVGYVGVGTVEFLVAGESFFFLEVNPRLQVEHGVTETLTGVDLVHLQIRIARGESIAGIVAEERGCAIEARVCAEDPAAGFLPAPGRVARFEPALGPRVRIDAGVAAGDVVPAVFDSLIAKVIASGETRDDARARLVAALRDLDLVVEGGATNKGWLIELLDSPELRAGGVDTGWLDRAAASGAIAGGALATESLVAAAILAYQRRRRDARRNFYADPAAAAPSRAPLSAGQELELSHLGDRYRLLVHALGSWRYRVQLDGRSLVATLRERDEHLAVLSLGGRTLRVLHDASELGMRVEVDGHAHFFGWQTAGEVRAVTPAMVVAVHVAPGDTVEAGQAIGLLEAMKMELAFAAPLAGVVREVRVRAGQQVAAGDVLLVVEPSGAASADGPGRGRLVLPEEADPLAAPALADPTTRAALRAELRAVLLGYDADRQRLERVVSLLESLAADELAPDARRDLARLRDEVVLLADLEQLFVRAPRIREDGCTEPSNAARLRLYVRRMRAGGAGLPDAFLALLRRALAHYGVVELTHDDALERAVLRLFATRAAAALRRRVARALLRALGELARCDSVLDEDATLGEALGTIADMREVVGDEVADAAMETAHLAFTAPAAARLAARASRAIDASLATARGGAALAGDAVLDLA